MTTAADTDRIENALRFTLRYEAPTSSTHDSVIALDDSSIPYLRSKNFSDPDGVIKLVNTASQTHWTQVMVLQLQALRKTDPDGKPIEATSQEKAKVADIRGKLGFSVLTLLVGGELYSRYAGFEHEKLGDLFTELTRHGKHQEQAMAGHFRRSPQAPFRPRQAAMLAAAANAAIEPVSLQPGA